jgi:hypothetical protein
LERGLFHVILDEHVTGSFVVARKQVIGNCTFPQVNSNLVPGALGVIPPAVHIFHRVRRGRHIL